MSFDFENKSQQVASTMKDNNDYLYNGLLYCGNCNTPKQCKINFAGKEAIVYCVCKCQQEKNEKARIEQEKKEQLERIERLRSFGLRDKNLKNCTFENAEGNEYIEKARKYCDNWEVIYKNNNGLLLWGDVGTGKTFVAGCIANKLIDNRIPVLMTSLIKIINDLQGFRISDKNEYLNELNNYKLLILDDLGAERQSDYALEQVFNVIDNRYRNEQPIIITTNLSLEELKNPKDTKYKRIYDRVLEMCVPMQFKGESKRIETAKDKLNILKDLLKE